MSLMEWGPTFAVQNEQIDYEHQRLFKMVNDLHEAVHNPLGDANETYMMIKLTLDQLVNYADYHFKTEETLMRETNYPKAVEHKAQHDALRAKVIDFKKLYATGKANVNDALMEFLRDWLVSHIKKTDVALGQFLAQQKAS